MHCTDHAHEGFGEAQKVRSRGHVTPHESLRNKKNFLEVIGSKIEIHKKGMLRWGPKPHSREGRRFQTRKKAGELD